MKLRFGRYFTYPDTPVLTVLVRNGETFPFSEPISNVKKRPVWPGFPIPRTYSRLGSFPNDFKVPLRA